MLEVYELVYIGLEVLIACLAVAGNVLVCWAVSLNTNLQSITYFFVVSLAVADIAVGLLAIPFAITISIGFCANFYGCLFIACFVLVLTQSSIFSLLAIAVDRYIAIKNPLRYNSLVTGQRAKGIITLCWILSVGIGLTPMLGWNRGWNTTAVTSKNCPEGLTQCLFEDVVTMDYMIYFNFFGCVLVPLLVMLVIYAHIFMAARYQLRLMGLKVAHTPAPGATTPSSSASRSTLQKEVHAAKSLSIIVGLFAVCWLPLHIINCFNYLCEDCERSDIWVTNIAIILSHANSVVNPLIYAYRIREFRQTFRRILYQHILGKCCHGREVESGAAKGAASCSFMWTASPSRKKKLSCATVGNSYVLDSSHGGTLPGATHEASCHWTLKSDDAANGHQRRNSGLSAMQRPCVTGFAAQDRIESGSCLGGTEDVSEVNHNGSCITFLNVHSLSLKQTDFVNSTELTEVS